MLRFLLRRLLVIVPTLFLVVTLAFFMMRAAPGSPFTSDRKLSPEIERNVMAKYGMNRPLAVQYVAYLEGVVRGDFGPSLKYKDKTVLEVIKEGFPKSITIGLSALVIASVCGVVLGVVAALRQNKGIDYAAMTLAILGVCIPTFVTAPLLVLLLASKLGWLPTAGWPSEGQGLGGIRYLVLP
ncbi:MAG: ABC transporter permease subunit [Caulobacteraceae bacterium]